MHCFVNEFGFAVAQFPACGAHDISPATAADRIVCTLQPPRLNHTPRLFQRVAWPGESRAFLLPDSLLLLPTARRPVTHLQNVLPIAMRKAEMIDLFAARKCGI